MISALKDSGIVNIGLIPQDWQLGRYKYFCSSRMGETLLAVDTSQIKDELHTIPVYSATQDDSIFGYVRNSSIKLRSGDLVIPARGNSIGCMTQIKDTVATCTQTTICSSKIHDIDARFLYYCSWGLKDEWYRYDGSAIPQITVSQVENNVLPLPPLCEQNIIANFLDKKCAEIDKLSEDIQEQIKILEDYKKSVITRAVTKGLNPNVEIKDSGVTWLKQIPVDWQVTKIKYLFKTGKGLNITKADLIPEGLPVINYGQIHSKDNNGTTIKDSLLRFVDFSYAKSNAASMVNKFDFVFADTSEDYDGCGNCVYKRDDSLLYAGYHDVILKSIDKGDHRFLAYLFLTDCWRKQIRASVSGVKVFSITQSILSNCSIVLPKEEERNKISDYLDEVCSEVELSVSAKIKQIESLAIYKKTIIYEYVTGKKRVKGAL